MTLMIISLQNAFPRSRVFIPAHTFLHVVPQAQQQREEGRCSARVIQMRQRTKEARFQPPTADIYGHRGQDPAWHYLSPCEFFAYWAPLEIRAPNARGQNLFSASSPDGELRMQSCRAARMVARPKPLIHLTVVEPGNDASHHTLPDTQPSRWVRHQWALLRQERPRALVLDKQQLPSSKRIANENGRLYNVYLRP